MYELVEALKEGAATLKRASPNPISLTAGCDLFIRYVTTAAQEFTVSILNLIFASLRRGFGAARLTVPTELQ